MVDGAEALSKGGWLSALTWVAVLPNSIVCGWLGSGTERSTVGLSWLFSALLPPTDLRPLTSQFDSQCAEGHTFHRAAVFPDRESPPVEPETPASGSA